MSIFKRIKKFTFARKHKIFFKDCHKRFDKKRDLCYYSRNLRKRGNFIMIKENYQVQVREYYEQVKRYLDSIIVGEDKAKEAITSAMLCDQNCRMLLAGDTGSGKTTLTKYLAKNFQSVRTSITADLLPSDIQKQLMQKRDVEFIQFDELNRASGKTQSALIELLAENQMTFENEQIKFNDFYVIATQNDKEVAGIFNIPQAVYDRFDMYIPFGNLTKEELENVLFDYKKPEGKTTIPIKDITSITSKAINSFNVDEKDRNLFMEIFTVINTQRYDGKVLFAGSNVRAHQFAIKLAKLSALMNGRNYIIPSDLSDFIPNLYLHRMNQNVLTITDNAATKKMEEIEEKVLKIKRERR